MNPKTLISSLPGIGNFYTTKLKRLNIETLEDLIYHFPFRYDDFSKTLSNSNISPGEKVNFRGNVWDIRNIRTRTGKFITKATVASQEGTVEVIWFNQPYLTKNIHVGNEISLSGKAQQDASKIVFKSPQYELVKEFLQNTSKETTIHTTGLVSVYPETEGITSKWIRTKIKSLLPLYNKTNAEYIPPKILKNQNLQDLDASLEKIHFPENYKDVEIARKRLGFDELFLTQLISQKKREEWQAGKLAKSIKIKEQDIKNFQDSLPYVLTSAQIRAVKEILEDLKKTASANRLLEGDVGSGKTIVAAHAIYAAFKNNLDSVLAAPTEILAFQHQKTLQDVLGKFNIKVGIWTKSKKEVGNITCGTHALLNSFSPEKEIGLVIVDEQHRFGVAQRSGLFLKHTQRSTPHLLTMTATPIPRTLALTLYGDLSLSILDQMPKGRQKISTFVVPNHKRHDCLLFIEKQVKEKKQAFIITPFVEPSESMQTIKAAKEEFENLKHKFSKKIKLGLLHGRLKSKEKEKTINDFKKNKINVLVTTPVVEVGIDVKNATVMVIESAERFGLAQLHQLRGRVGRGEHKSFCFLFATTGALNSQKRLKSLEKVHVGFELAEIDLKMRGPGEVFGLKQSGFENFKVADIFDPLGVSNAQKEAQDLLKEDQNLLKYPSLKEKIDSLKSSTSQPN